MRDKPLQLVIVQCVELAGTPSHFGKLVELRHFPYLMPNGLLQEPYSWQSGPQDQEDVRGTHWRTKNL